MSQYDRQLKYAEKKLGVKLRRHTSRKANGPCPSCGGDDRFVVWIFDKSAWCSRCNLKMEYGDNNGETTKPYDAEIADQVARLEMATCTDWMEYHMNLLRNGDFIDEWARQGINVTNIETYGLGYCPRCPIVPTNPSLTMPVFHKGLLVDIRHKVLGHKSIRYVSHLPELLPYPFNADSLEGPMGIVVMEGIKKAIITAETIRGEMERDVSAIYGANAYKKLFEIIKEGGSGPIYFMLDPDAADKSVKYAQYCTKMGRPGFVVDLFEKPDDLLINYGKEVLIESIKQARYIA